MTSIVKKSFNTPDETITPGEKIKAEVINIGDIKVQKVTAEVGWKWSEDIKPVIKTESCEKHHQLYMISGKLAAAMADGNAEEFSAGDMGDIPPGHDGWTVGDEPAVWLEVLQ
jgi:hypothetical protein